MVTVISGGTFFVSNDRGDASGRETEGLFEGDVRHLSRWSLLVDGAPIHLLSSGNLDHATARFYGTIARAHIGHNPPVTVARSRQATQDVQEEIVVRNNSSQQKDVVVEVRCGADFLDIFEVRDTTSWGRGERDATLRHRGDRSIDLALDLEGFSRTTRISFSLPFEATKDGARFELDLPPRETWRLDVHLLCFGDGIDGVRLRRVASPHLPVSSDPAAAPAAPELETDAEMLRLSYRKSLADLAALRLPAPGVPGGLVPAAGLPWFMALFGRDSLITAFQTLPFLPDLARATLKSLALLQSTRHDDYRDAEPGKILHELRRGKLAFLGKVPHSPYYGTHDATPLFLVLLDEYERWTADVGLVLELKEPALRALEWMELHGDLDGDGYLEYLSRSDRGLRNQCWKDSEESIAFAGGEVASGPIATCEIQGYAYDARMRTARLARRVWRDEGLATRLERDAQVLKERFNRDFWCDDGHFALALDGDKRLVDSMTSNVGHLLWSGIVDDARADAVVERLLARDMCNGWGIRTMSARDASYNPIGYHVGTVWPHDTGLVAEGLRRYGRTVEASALVCGLHQAAVSFEYRLPEVFAGFDREDTVMPVEYPTASSPQAWAAGAILLGLRTMLGLDATEEELLVRPQLPDGVKAIRLRGIPFRGTLADV